MESHEARSNRWIVRKAVARKQGVSEASEARTSEAEWSLAKRVESHSLRNGKWQAKNYSPRRAGKGFYRRSSGECSEKSERPLVESADVVLGYCGEGQPDTLMGDSGVSGFVGSAKPLALIR